MLAVEVRHVEATCRTLLRHVACCRSTCCFDMLLVWTGLNAVRLGCVELLSMKVRFNYLLQQHCLFFDAPSACSRFSYIFSLHFETRTRQMRLRSKIDANFRAHFDTVKFMKGMDEIFE